jgi:signal transduction histidine kinase
VSAAEVLLRFSRMAASADEPDAILRLLAQSSTGEVGADAAAVLRVTPSGQVVVAASVGLPPELSAAPIEAEIIGPELAAELISRTEGRFVDARVVPLVADGDLFGVLVLLCHVECTRVDEHGPLAQGLGDLAAIALSKAAKYAELQRSYEQLRASREALAQAEKLRALGQMAAGVSHDLKNLLNPLGLLTQLLRRRIQRGQDALPVVDQLEAALKTGVETLERLREFSRQEREHTPQRVQLDREVARAVEVCRPRVHQVSGLEITEALDSGATVLVVASDLFNAVVNLVLNATEAMPAGGRITVRTGIEASEPWLSVEDDGPGMPPEIERRVFEPFFTTKAEGTGLGLANVYAFMQRHGGRVELRTEPGAGTRFVLRFPASAS